MNTVTSRMGWAGEDDAAAAWDLIGSEFQGFEIAQQQAPRSGKTFRAWDITRTYLDGRDLPTPAQQTGDCVAVSLGDVVDMTALLEIVLGEPEEFHKVFAPFHYAVSRVIYSQNRYKGSGGAIGSYTAKAVGQYGVLRTDEVGVPTYSRDVANSWGDDDPAWRKFQSVAKPHTLSSARVGNWSQLVDALNNGYLATMASSIGFEMKARSDGFHYKSGTWEHQMGVWGLSDDPKKPWIGLHNQWGDQHGKIVDFETGETWPKGMLRVRPDDIERAFTNGEVMVYSQFQGFPDQSARIDEWAMI